MPTDICKFPIEETKNVLKFYISLQISSKWQLLAQNFAFLATNFPTPKNLGGEGHLPPLPPCHGTSVILHTWRLAESEAGRRAWYVWNTLRTMFCAFSSLWLAISHGTDSGNSCSLPSNNRSPLTAMGLLTNFLAYLTMVNNLKIPSRERTIEGK